MKLIFLMSFMFISATMLLSAQAHAEAGDKGNGGIFVEVDGQWVPYDEASDYYQKSYFGVSDLIDSDCYGEEECEQSTFGLALKDWLLYLKKLHPALHREISSRAELVEFRLVNHKLTFNPKELPQGHIDYKEYKKAAIYRLDHGNNGVVWVSLPVLNEAGQINRKRLTSRENQGFLFLHELINARYGSAYNANQIADLGMSIIKAKLQDWSTEEFIFHNLKVGSFDLLTMRNVSFDIKKEVMQRLYETKIINRVIPFSKIKKYLVPRMDDIQFYQDLVDGKFEIMELISNTEDLIAVLNVLQRLENKLIFRTILSDFLSEDDIRNLSAKINLGELERYIAPRKPAHNCSASWLLSWILKYKK